MTTATPVRMFTSDTGRTWAVRVLPVGARYGRTDSLVIDDMPAVEFYDTTYADGDDGRAGAGFGPLGQFVSRYDIPVLLGIHPYNRIAADQDTGLILAPEGPEWRVDAATMRHVRTWLREQYLPRVVLSPEPGYGSDFWVSRDSVELVMTCRYVRRPGGFSVMWVGPEGEGRRQQGGPVVSGPYGDLIPQASIIAAHPLPRPAKVFVAAGYELDLVLVGTGQTEADAPVVRVRITDERGLDYPRLVACG